MSDDTHTQRLDALVSAIAENERQQDTLAAAHTAMCDELHELLTQHPELLGTHANGKPRRSTELHGYKVGLQAKGDAIIRDGRARTWKQIKRDMFRSPIDEVSACVYEPELAIKYHKLQALPDKYLSQYMLKRQPSPDSLICRPLTK